MDLPLLEKDAFLTLVDGGDKLCIRCGHCVAVCPHSAMSHAIMKPEECQSVNEDWLFSPEQVEHFLRYLRSIRNYKNKQVEQEVLTKLISVARFAPSGHNFQPVKWLVILMQQRSSGRHCNKNWGFLKEMLASDQ